MNGHNRVGGVDAFIRPVSSLTLQGQLLRSNTVYPDAVAQAHDAVAPLVQTLVALTSVGTTEVLLAVGRNRHAADDFFARVHHAGFECCVLPEAALDVGPVSVSVLRLVVLLVSIGIIGGTYLLINGTKLGKEDLERWLGLAKVATPVLLPILYKVVSNAQGSSAPPAAVDLKSEGINATGPGAALGVRIVRLEQTLDQLSTARSGERAVTDFISATRSRLGDLRTAVEAAEITPTAQRREVHSSISGELDRINKDVFARLGVKA